MSRFQKIAASFVASSVLFTTSAYALTTEQNTAVTTAFTGCSKDLILIIKPL